MNGTKTMTAGLLLAALFISSSGIAAQENLVSPGGPSGLTTNVTVGPDGAIYRSITISPEDRQGPTTIYDPGTGQSVFIPTIVPPELVPPALQLRGGDDPSGGTISRSIPELPIEIQKATLREFLESPHFSDLDVDLDAIPPAILNAELDDLRLDPSMMAVVQSMVTGERLEMLFDSLLNNPGQITSDMLETIQMPTGTGS